MPRNIFLGVLVTTSVVPLCACGGSVAGGVATVALTAFDAGGDAGSRPDAPVYGVAIAAFDAGVDVRELGVALRAFDAGQDAPLGTVAISAFDAGQDAFLQTVAACCFDASPPTTDATFGVALHAFDGGDDSGAMLRLPSKRSSGS